MLLARTLGCTVAELGERMSADEYEWHRADYAISPFGPERMADLPAATIATLLANIHRDDKHAPFTVGDFMPFQEAADEAIEPTADNLRAFVQHVNQD